VLGGQPADGIGGLGDLSIDLGGGVMLFHGAILPFPGAMVYRFSSPLNASASRRTITGRHPFSISSRMK
jgi:hypothetical protein